MVQSYFLPLLPWGWGYPILQIPFCGGWACIDKLIWRNSGIYTNEDFSHVWLRNVGFTPPVLGGGTYRVTSGYLKDRLDPWGTKGKFLVLTPGGVTPLCCTRGGGQVRVVVGVRTWSHLHMWYSLLVPRGLSLTTVTRGSAFAPGQKKVILSGS